MKTQDISISSALMRAFLAASVVKAQSMWAILVGARVYRCGAVVVLGSALALNAAAQSEVPTEKPKIKLAFKLADLWLPYGVYCKFYNIPNYNSTTGIFSVAVGNQGKASSPSCSLRIIEKRKEIESIDGPWTFYKEYFAPVPSMTPDQQVLVKVQVAKWSGGFDSKGKPIKHPRQWIFKADGKNQVIEVNEGNNGLVWKTLN